MVIRPRADIDALPRYAAGGNAGGTIRLADNEVPDGPLPSVAKAIAEAAAQANRYPEIGVTALTGRLARKLGLPGERVAVGCGSVSLCQQLVQAMCQAGDEVLFAWRSFEAYPIVTRIGGAKAVRVPLGPAHTHDLIAMAAAITPRTRLVFVCNPNNPTGTAVRREELSRFLAEVPPHVLVVLDEAYREFVTDPAVPDGLDFARIHDNVAVLRTFSKAYGLAGLRVGYMAGPAPVVDAVCKVRIPFSVNSLAQAAAQAALDAEDELIVRCAAITAERERTRAGLLASGYEVPDAQANFLWLPLGDRTTKFTEHMLANEISVRAFPGDGVRVTVGGRQENDALLEAARTFH